MELLVESKKSDVSLFEHILRFLLEHFDEIIPVKRLTEELANTKRRSSLSRGTVKEYLNELIKSYLFYSISRYDLKTNTNLPSTSKYIPVDIGISSFINSSKPVDKTQFLKNIVYLELLRKNYTVYIGKLENDEVGFIAIKNSRKFLIQIVEPDDVKVINKLQRIFNKIENYQKVIITTDKYKSKEDGISYISIIDFLLKQDLI